MDDGSSPIILILVLLVISIIELVFLIIFYKKAKIEKVTEDDVISLVNEGHEDGNILTSEAVMIQNIFEFSDTDAKDIMVHRKNIVALDGELTLRETIDFINENHFSRYPVYVDDLEHIIGILHIKDLFGFISAENMDMKIKDIPNLLGEAESVTETHSINALFAKMQAKKRHMVIVIDEYGQVSGVLSMEDILEEIVGNIEDEHDEHDTLIEKNDDNSYAMDGSTTLEDAQKILNIQLSEDFETLNGYLVSLLGKIPEDNSIFSLEDDNFTYDIKGVTGKVIDEVIVKPKTPIVIE